MIPEGFNKSTQDRNSMPKHIYDAYCEYLYLNLLHYCDFQSVQIGFIVPPSLLKHPLTAKDRLGNPDIKFPIAFIYGDQDFLTSDNGAEEIIKNNCHYGSGRSQIFTMKDATHAIYLDDPGQFMDILTGFTDGTITHTMQLHHAGAFTMHPRKKM